MSVRNWPAARGHRGRSGKQGAAVLSGNPSTRSPALRTLQSLAGNDRGIEVVSARPPCGWLPGFGRPPYRWLGSGWCGVVEHAQQGKSAGRAVHRPRDGRRRPGDVARNRRPAVLIVESHRGFGDLLAALLAGRYDADVVAKATTLADARRSYASCVPDLAVINTDLVDGDGLDMVRDIGRAPSPRPVVVLITTAATHAAVRRHTAANDDVVCIAAEIAGGAGAVTAAIDRALETIGHDSPPRRIERALSPREKDVFRLIGAGLSTEAIASRLAISRQTVETHRKSITRKLSATGARLVRLAVLHGVDGPAVDGPADEG